MSDKEIAEIISRIQNETRNICRTQQSAKSYLEKIGINKADGSLTPEYLQKQ